MYRAAARCCTERLRLVEEAMPWLLVISRCHVSRRVHADGISRARSDIYWCLGRHCIVHFDVVVVYLCVYFHRGSHEAISNYLLHG